VRAVSDAATAAVADPSAAARPLPRLLSIVTPAFNEADNLPRLRARLDVTLARLDVAWEWIVVDDASDDGTRDVLADLCRLHPCVHAIGRPRRRGSHAAILRGCRAAHGEAVVVLAADLQDPPEVIPALLAQWRHGADVVWGARVPPNDGEPRPRLGPLYYWLMRHVAGLRALPAHGADLVLMDATVAVGLRRRRRSSSVFAEIAALGRHQVSVPAERAPRRHGRSGWTLARRLRLGVGSLVAFSAARARRRLGASRAS
jgi:dolichol-phosphate mannosyltransferase